MHYKLQQNIFCNQSVSKVVLQLEYKTPESNLKGTLVSNGIRQLEHEGCQRNEMRHRVKSQGRQPGTLCLGPKTKAKNWLISPPWDTVILSVVPIGFTRTATQGLLRLNADVLRI